MRFRTAKQAGRRAAAAVEAAIILPAIIVLIFGVWEVGRLIQMNQILSNAAREGARQASTGNVAAAAPTWTVHTYVANYLQNSGLAIPANSVTVTVANETQNLTNTGVASIDSTNLTQVDVAQSGTAPTSDPVLSANRGDVVRVDVSFPFDAGRIAPVNSFFFLGMFNVQASAKWTCMKDTPITVTTTIPGAPL